MIEPIGRSVPDTRMRGYDGCCVASAFHRHCERSEAIHCHPAYGRMDCFASLAMTAEIAEPPRTKSQQLGLFRRDHLAVANRAAGDHLGLDPAVAVAEPALQRLPYGEGLPGRIRVDADGGAGAAAL